MGISARRQKSTRQTIGRLTLDSAIANATHSLIKSIRIIACQSYQCPGSTRTRDGLPHPRPRLISKPVDAAAWSLRHREEILIAEGRRDFHAGRTALAAQSPSLLLILHGSVYLLSLVA